MGFDAPTLLLALAAAFNGVIGVSGLVGRASHPQGRVVAVLVLAFGLLYAIAATDPARFGPVLWAGVAGKSGVVAMMLPAAARGEGPKGLAALLMIDAVFVGIFLVLLFGMA